MENKKFREYLEGRFKDILDNEDLHPAFIVGCLFGIIHEILEYNKKE